MLPILFLPDDMTFVEIIVDEVIENIKPIFDFINYTEVLNQLRVA